MNPQGNGVLAPYRLEARIPQLLFRVLHRMPNRRVPAQKLAKGLRERLGLPSRHGAQEALRGRGGARDALALRVAQGRGAGGADGALGGGEGLDVGGDVGLFGAGERRGVGGWGRAQLEGDVLGAHCDELAVGHLCRW